MGGSVGTALAARALSTDSTLALLSEGYAFVPRRRERYGSDVFETRLMLTKAVCVTGEEAAEVFYEPGRFTRKGALPQTILRLLQDRGSVQVMDGEAHRHRKWMFMSLMTPAGIAGLADAIDEEWRARMGGREGARLLFPGEVLLRRLPPEEPAPDRLEGLHGRQDKRFKPGQQQEDPG